MTKTTLIALDIDNTVFDWVGYYVNSLYALFEELVNITGLPIELLETEAKEVFTRYDSIEYPFLVQEMPSVEAHFEQDIDRLISLAVEPARDRFLSEASVHLKPYDDVKETLQYLTQRQCQVIALTDAPRYVAMWKLNKLGILHQFDAVYGLADPMIPVCKSQGKPKVSQAILLKHLNPANFGFKGRIRILPDEYEKPGTKGLKMALIDYELDDDPTHRKQVLWVGDNLRKDVGLGNRLGVRTAWAKYGTSIAERDKNRLLRFSPPQNIHKNVMLDPDISSAPIPDYVLNTFSDIIDILR